MTLNLREMLTGKARLVAHVTRFAGTPLHRLENVAEHSYMTAQYALFIGLHCQELGYEIDLGKLLSRALVHDLDEAVMVDLPRPVKHGDMELLARWNKLCHGVVRDMSNALGVPFFDLWAGAKDTTVEGKILALADLISVTSYIIEEIRFGNTFMHALLPGNIAYLRNFLNGGTLPAPIHNLTLDAISIARSYVQEPYAPTACSDR